MGKEANKEAKFFWQVAEHFLADEAVTKSTMMGFPCLRVNGDFFASCDHQTGDLIVKMAADRVEELIDADEGHPFAPNGRRFREWVLFTDRDAGSWNARIEDAKTFVIENPSKKKKKK